MAGFQGLVGDAVPESVPTMMRLVQRLLATSVSNSMTKVCLKDTVIMFFPNRSESRWGALGVCWGQSPGLTVNL